MAERFDLEAIAADDALLDRLAAGGEGLYDALDAGGDDPAVRMLGDLRLAVEVAEDEQPGAPDDELERILAQSAGKGAGADPLARKIAARTLALGVAAVAGLSVSGVAAAVTGDPLSPYEKVIEKVVDGLSPQSTVPIRSVGGVVSSKSASKNAVKEYKWAVENKGSQTTRPEQSDPDAKDKTTAVGDVLSRDRARIEPDLPPLVKKEPVVAEKLDKPTEPLVPDKPTDPALDKQPTEPSELETKVDPPPSDPTSEPTADPTQQPTQPVDPTTPPPSTTTEPTPTPSGETNEPSSGDTGDTTTGDSSDTNTSGTGDTSTGDTEAGDGSTDGKTEGEAQGTVDTQAPEEQPSDPPTPVPTPTTQPSQPSEPASSDPAEKPSDESSAPGSGSDQSDHTDRPGADRRPPAPGQLANQIVQQILATLNGVMAPR